MLFAAGDDHQHHYEPNPVAEVQDTGHWEFFETLFGNPVAWHLPPIDLNVIGIPHKIQITKFMVLELIAAVLIILIYVPLARRIREGGLPKGRFWNFFEALLTFIRDEVARPNLDKPKHDGGIAVMTASTKNQRGEVVATADGKILVANRPA